MVIITKTDKLGIEHIISVPHLIKETDTIKHNVLYGYISIKTAWRKYEELYGLYSPLTDDPEDKKEYEHIFKRFRELLDAIRTEIQ